MWRWDVHGEMGQGRRLREKGQRLLRRVEETGGEWTELMVEKVSRRSRHHSVRKGVGVCAKLRLRWK